MTYSKNQKKKVKVIIIITVFKTMALAWLSTWNKFLLGSTSTCQGFFSPGYPCSHWILWHSQTPEKFLHLQISALCSHFPKRTTNTETWLVSVEPMIACCIYALFTFFNLKMETEFTWSNWSLQIPFLKIPCATSVRRWTWGTQITTYTVVYLKYQYCKIIIKFSDWAKSEWKQNGCIQKTRLKGFGGEKNAKT